MVAMCPSVNTATSDSGLSNRLMTCIHVVCIPCKDCFAAVLDISLMCVQVVMMCLSFGWTEQVLRLASMRHAAAAAKPTMAWSLRR